MRSTSVLFPAVLSLSVCFQGSGQEVLSARSGVVHFLEGAVFIDGQAIDRKFGSFPNIKEGSTLRTEKGRVEILLTPSVFLRLDEKSSIHMVSSSLVDTRVEFLGGSAILDSVDAPVNNSVLVTYKNFQMRFPKQGVYRFDSATDVLQAYSGEAEVKHEGKTAKVDTSHLYFFFPGVETEKIGEGTFDEFYDWANDRNQVISAQNQAAAQDEAEADDMQDAQVVPLNPYPNVGVPNSGPLPTVPMVGMGGVYPSASGSILFDPYIGLGARPYLPYGIYPVFVPVRPYRHNSAYWQQHPRPPNAQWPRNPRWTHRENPQWPRSNNTSWPRPMNSQWPRIGTGQWQHPMNPQWQHTGQYPHVGVRPTVPQSFVSRPSSPAVAVRPAFTPPRTAPMPLRPAPAIIPHPMGGAGPRPSGR